MDLGPIAAMAINPTVAIGTGAQLYGAYMQQQGQKEANETNFRMSREQMEFQERMSSTAHQRQVEDLRKAGLNPILSANAGASSPAGSSATMQNVNEGMAATARDIVQMGLNVQRQKSEIALMNAQAKKADIEGEVAKKGIPEADIKNRIYNQVSPFLDKVEKWMGTGAKNQPKLPSANPWQDDYRSTGINVQNPYKERFGDRLGVKEFLRKKNQLP